MAAGGTGISSNPRGPAAIKYAAIAPIAVKTATTAASRKNRTRCRRLRMENFAEKMARVR